MSGRLIVLSNAADGRDDEFNDWYTNVHLGEVLALGPFVSAQRYKIGDTQIFPQTHGYVAIYDFEGDPQAAVDALTLRADELNMSDALADPMVVVIEPLTGLVTR